MSIKLFSVLFFKTSAMGLTDIENKLPVVTSEKREGRGNTGMEEWQVQLLGVIRGYKDAFYNTGNIIYIL